MARDLERLWSDPKNWTAFGYRCSEDPRVVVPKRVRSLGWTLNWAHPKAWPTLAMFFAIAIGPALSITLILALIGVSRPEIILGAVTATIVVSTVAIVLIALHLARTA